MKKLLVIALTIVITTCICACDPGNAPSDNQNSVNNSQNSVDSTQDSIGNTENNEVETVWEKEDLEEESWLKTKQAYENLLAFLGKNVDTSSSEFDIKPTKNGIVVSVVGNDEFFEATVNPDEFMRKEFESFSVGDDRQAVNKILSKGVVWEEQINTTTVECSLIFFKQNILYFESGSNTHRISRAVRITPTGIFDTKNGTNLPQSDLIWSEEEINNGKVEQIVEFYKGIVAYEWGIDPDTAKMDIYAVEKGIKAFLNGLERFSEIDICLYESIQQELDCITVGDTLHTVMAIDPAARYPFLGVSSAYPTDGSSYHYFKECYYHITYDDRIVVKIVKLTPDGMSITGEDADRYTDNLWSEEDLQEES